MDPFAVIVLLLISFLAWQYNIQWLFLGGLVLLIIMARSIAITVAVLGGIGFLYYFGMKEYWWIVLCIIAGIVIVISTKKGGGHGADAGGEMYSPELMRLLGG